jgi:AraC-like DNA-binding protein
MSEAYSLSLVCDEFDQFNELAKNWDVDFRALSSSNTESIHLFQSHTGQTQLSFVHFDLAVDQRALAPVGTRNIAILPPNHPDLYWCGKHITGGQVLLFNKSGEMESISKQGFEVFSLSVPEHWLKSSANINSSISVRDEEQVIRCDKNDIATLYGKLSSLSDILQSNTATDVASLRLQDATLFEGLSSLFESASHQAFSLAKERRMKVLGDALHFIHTKRERVPVSEICHYAIVSERTLERLFNSVLGLSPKKYLNRFLLQEAHNCLKQSAPEDTTVMAVAHKLGFIHLGQFSADYYGCFNELPSETLKKTT